MRRVADPEMKTPCLENLELSKGHCFTPTIGQYVTLHASLAAGDSALLVSAFSVHSTSSSPFCFFFWFFFISLMILSSLMIVSSTYFIMSVHVLCSLPCTNHNSSFFLFSNAVEYSATSPPVDRKVAGECVVCSPLNTYACTPTRIRTCVIKQNITQFPSLGRW